MINDFMCFVPTQKSIGLVRHVVQEYMYMYLLNFMEMTVAFTIIVKNKRRWHSFFSVNYFGNLVYYSSYFASYLDRTLHASILFFFYTGCVSVA